MESVRSRFKLSQAFREESDVVGDHELLIATRDGDSDAFYELVRRYRNPITNFLYRMLNDYDHAVELAQETFVRVFANAARYRADYNFSTYIYKIASNLAISELRTRKRRRFVPLVSTFETDSGEILEREIQDAKPLQDVTLIERERKSAVSRAITSLPEKYRVAVILRDVEGLSYERITQILGLTEGTVKSRINRARSLLKSKLQAYL